MTLGTHELLHARWCPIVVRVSKWTIQIRNGNQTDRFSWTTSVSSSCDKDRCTVHRIGENRDGQLIARVVVGKRETDNSCVTRRTLARSLLAGGTTATNANSQRETRFKDTNVDQATAFDLCVERLRLGKKYRKVQ